MTKSWYVVNRPQTIDEIDEEKVRDAILSFVKNGKFPHALLFAGPKGTGKTSTARIVAKILNCDGSTALTTAGSQSSPPALNEPCNKCDQCVSITNGTSMSVIEVDAASHRGIDDIRALRETVKLMPAGGRTKVYIIDEVHMLTTEAFNALLKTLEEPPENVVFILATTDPQKIPDTIKSRSTLVTKVLEQLSVGGKITKKDVEEFFSANLSDPEEFLKLVASKNSKIILAEIEKLVSKGINVRQFTIQLIETLHQSLLTQAGVGITEITLPFQLNETKILIELFSKSVEEMQNAPIAELPLELVMIEWCNDDIEPSQTMLTSEVSPAGKTDTSEVSNGDSNRRDVHSKTDSTSFKNIGKGERISDETWKQLLAKIKSQNFSLEALLRSARPLSFNGQDVTLSVFYKFHKEKLEEENHRRMLEQVLCELLGAEAVRVFFVLGEKPKTVIADDAVIITDEAKTSESEDITKVAEEIFGVEVHD
ncbi:DNA polymerase III subunit gamma/tau [Candidatus Microgenomates bacterium]|nr:DNA polymerase III subunit gamma/tau [Candidatus Microgenomates bacterium]